jgi:hydrogenase-4 component E
VNLLATASAGAVLPAALQGIHLFAALLLLLSFAMLSQRRVMGLIWLFAWQGALLAGSSVLVAWSTGQPELYGSALLALLLKVLVLPWVLLRLTRRLHAQWDIEPLLNIPGMQLIGMALVLFAFALAQPLQSLAHGATRGLLGIAMAVVFLALLMMISRRNAIAQVLGFLSLENGLLFAATAATRGMPMVVELGIGLDLLVGVFILGVFVLRIREQFDSLELPPEGPSGPATRLPEAWPGDASGTAPGAAPERREEG